MLAHSAARPLSVALRQNAATTHTYSGHELLSAPLMRCRELLSHHSDAQGYCATRWDVNANLHEFRVFALNCIAQTHEMANC